MRLRSHGGVGPVEPVCRDEDADRPAADKLGRRSTTGARPSHLPRSAAVERGSNALEHHIASAIRFDKLAVIRMKHRTVRQRRSIYRRRRRAVPKMLRVISRPSTVPAERSIDVNAPDSTTCWTRPGSCGAGAGGPGW